MVNFSALDSPALPVLLALTAAGIRFRLDGEQVLVSPRGVLTSEQREVFQQHPASVRTLVSALTDRDVQERVVEFRRQLAAVPAPRCPAFLFKAGIHYVTGTCFSCGERLPAPR